MNISQLFNGTNSSTYISSTPSTLPIFGYAVGGVVAILGFYYTYQLCCNGHRPGSRQTTGLTERFINPSRP